MQKLYNGIEGGLVKAEKGYALETSLKLGKDKLEVYWLRMIDETHYYYASIILYPASNSHGLRTSGEDIRPGLRKSRTV